jgi:hypothetical protein
MGLWGRMDANGSKTAPLGPFVKGLSLEILPLKPEVITLQNDLQEKLPWTPAA